MRRVERPQPERCVELALRMPAADNARRPVEPALRLKHLPADRMLVGSHATYFAPEAAPLKLKESDLGEALRRQIAKDNAAKVLDWS